MSFLDSSRQKRKAQVDIEQSGSPVSRKLVLGSPSKRPRNAQPAPSSAQSSAPLSASGSPIPPKSALPSDASENFKTPVIHSGRTLSSTPIVSLSPESPFSPFAENGISSSLVVPLPAGIEPISFSEIAHLQSSSISFLPSSLSSSLAAASPQKAIARGKSPAIPSSSKNAASPSSFSIPSSSIPQNEVSNLQKILYSRMKPGDSPDDVPLRGYEEFVMTLGGMLYGAAVNGKSSTTVLLGPHGTGKTATYTVAKRKVERKLAIDFRSRVIIHRPIFFEIRLDGRAYTKDREVLVSLQAAANAEAGLIGNDFVDAESVDSATKAGNPVLEILRAVLAKIDTFGSSRIKEADDAAETAAAEVQALASLPLSSFETPPASPAKTKSGSYTPIASPLLASPSTPSGKKSSSLLMRKMSQAASAAVTLDPTKDSDYDHIRAAAGSRVNSPLKALHSPSGGTPTKSKNSKGEKDAAEVEDTPRPPSSRVVFVIFLKHLELLAGTCSRALYHLFDAVNSKKMPLVVLASSSNSRVLDLLEKRVKSRLSATHMNFFPVNGLLKRIQKQQQQKKSDEEKEREKAEAEAKKGKEKELTGEAKMNAFAANDIRGELVLRWLQIPASASSSSSIGSSSSSSSPAAASSSTLLTAVSEDYRKYFNYSVQQLYMSGAIHRALIAPIYRFTNGSMIELQNRVCDAVRMLNSETAPVLTEQMLQHAVLLSGGYHAQSSISHSISQLTHAEISLLIMAKEFDRVEQQAYASGGSTVNMVGASKKSAATPRSPANSPQKPQTPNGNKTVEQIEQENQQQELLAASDLTNRIKMGAPMSTFTFQDLYSLYLQTMTNTRKQLLHAPSSAASSPMKPIAVNLRDAFPVSNSPMQRARPLSRFARMAAAASSSAIALPSASSSSSSSSATAASSSSSSSSSFFLSPTEILLSFEHLKAAYEKLINLGFFRPVTGAYFRQTGLSVLERRFYSLQDIRETIQDLLTQYSEQLPLSNKLVEVASRR